MPTIALEMERLRNPYSGLGQYCLHLGQALVALRGTAEQGFVCLVPAGQVGALGDDVVYKVVKPWHKIVGLSLHESLWHCMHQDSAYMPRSRKTPLVITIHDLNFLDRTDYPAAKKAKKLAAMQQKTNRASGLVYISKYVQQWVHENLKVPSGTLERVIYNGGSFNYSASDAHKVSARANKSPFLFSIGIHPKKNYHVLMPILQAFPEYRWIIAGPDSRGYKSKIQQAAEQAGVAERIEFCGSVGEAEKRAYYETCVALLFPSLSEGFGLPVVEAMSLGTPVFVSSRTSMPEIGGKEAYYFKDFKPETLVEAFSAGIKDFKADPAKPERMQNWAAQFNWNTAALSYIEFYNKILNR